MSNHEPSKAPRIAVILCAVLEIEVEHYVQGLTNVIAIEKLPQGLHNEPPKLRVDLQAAVDRIEANPAVEAIVLGYGLCSRGVENVTTKRCTFVIPRAHDCITVLLGSKERYGEYVKQNPGTYWYSPGWNKHHIPPGKDRYEKLREAYVEKYGEDNADFLMESEQAWFKSYDRATYVDLRVGATKEDVDYTARCAEWLKWSFDRQTGDPRLLIDMLRGNWDSERFLVLAPGQSIRMTADERVIEAVDGNGEQR